MSIEELKRRASGYSYKELKRSKEALDLNDRPTSFAYSYIPKKIQLFNVQHVSIS